VTISYVAIGGQATHTDTVTPGYPAGTPQPAS
jgi:hypothetical protein